MGRLTLLGGVVGLMAGVSSWAFLESLDVVTSTRLDRPRLLWLLPIAGFVIAAVYRHGGGRSREGNALLLAEIHEPTRWVPRRMAPLVYVGTVVTHLFGGSVGREGTALQMSGSLTDALCRAIGVRPEGRRELLVAAMAGGFGAVFGVPLAGVVFAMEVPHLGRRRRVRGRLAALLPAVAASFGGDLVVTGLGYHHSTRGRFPGVLAGSGQSFRVTGSLVVAGAVFGLTATCFVLAVRLVKRLGSVIAPWAPIRAAFGGTAVVAIAAVVGRDGLGLSLPLIDRALAGDHTAWTVPLLKIVLTALCLGSGFPGGEVTPLFVIGATLGAAMAPGLGLPVASTATLGYLAVFAGAAHAPVTCVVMGIELFGWPVAGPAMLVCGVAWVVASVGPAGIYPRPTTRGET